MSKVSLLTKVSGAASAFGAWSAYRDLKDRRMGPALVTGVSSIALSYLATSMLREEIGEEKFRKLIADIGSVL